MICFFSRLRLRSVLNSIIKKWQGKEIKKFEYVVDLGLGVSICLDVVSTFSKTSLNSQENLTFSKSSYRQSRNRDFSIQSRHHQASPSLVVVNLRWQFIPYVSTLNKEKNSVNTVFIFATQGRSRIRLEIDLKVET